MQEECEKEVLNRSIPFHMYVVGRYCSGKRRYKRVVILIIGTDHIFTLS